MPEGYQYRMELRQLRYFVAVAETEHFRRAAQALGVAQPALSRQVAALERELGVGLFERLPRGVRLSEPGRVLLDESKRMLGDASEIGERVRRVARGQVGRLRIAFSEAASGHAALTDSIRGFRAAQPEVELSLVSMRSAAQVEALRQGAIDAGFQYRLALPDDEFGRFELTMENVRLALPQSHRLARRRSLGFADLRDEPLICIARNINPHFYDSLMAAFLAARIAPRIVQEASSTIVLSLVSVGMGLGIVSSALRWHAPQDLIFRPVRGLSLANPFDLVWRRDNRSPVLTRFVDQVITLRKSARKPPSGRKRSGT
jgi:DNA-binding transcriptional LysR family regulator